MIACFGYEKSDEPRSMLPAPKCTAVGWSKRGEWTDIGLQRCCYGCNIWMSRKKMTGSSLDRKWLWRITTDPTLVPLQTISRQSLRQFYSRVEPNSQNSNNVTLDGDTDGRSKPTSLQMVIRPCLVPFIICYFINHIFAH